MHLSPKDFDVATSAHPPEVRELFAHVVEVGAAFGVLRVHQRDPDGALHEIEVATFRAEAGYSDGRRPDEVRFTDAREDVLRRDFTINGLLCDPLDVRDEGAAVVDWVGGMTDLEQRRLRAIGEPRERFTEDALRLLRAPRFAARFGLTLAPETARAALELAPTLARVSAERVRDELQAMLRVPSAPQALKLIAELRLGDVLWPDLAALPDGQAAAAHRMALAHKEVAQLRGEHLPDGHPLEQAMDLPLALALTLHPVRSAWTPVRLAGMLKLSRHELRRLAVIWQLADALPTPLTDVHVVNTKPELMRLLRAPDADAALVLRGALAPDDIAGALRLDRARVPHAKWSPELFVTGDTLHALGRRPGPPFRAALLAAEDAQLLGGNAQAALAAALATFAAS
jgi:poly(A) polymerase